jgi:hypothetical protein
MQGGLGIVPFRTRWAPRIRTGEELRGSRAFALYLAAFPAVTTERGPKVCARRLCARPGPQVGGPGRRC